MEASAEDIHRLRAAVSDVVSDLRSVRHRGNARTLTVFQTIADHERMRPSDVATVLGVHRSAVAHVLGDLADAGYIEAIGDPEDQRSYWVRLTEAGRVEMLRLTKVGLLRLGSFIEDWKPDDVRELGALLTRLDESIVKANHMRTRPARSMRRRLTDGPAQL